ncbi:hypothetical protein [Methylovulum sp.]|jgi:hypothetical protein|uniref:hypothetical protein n=1 Tax=Methylovulum sp. TaxID=1916980 RepID=UPI002607DC3B|nr:hypothetical protein [Methylovulum sp.]MDD5125698.1 hypothetical protein [Methylovulum sp.]
MKRWDGVRARTDYERDYGLWDGGGGSVMSDICSLLLKWSLPGVTFILACSTVWLAWNTRKMAKSTEKALKQNAQLVAETHELVESNKILVESEERHHQDLLKPLCTLSRSVEDGTLKNTSIFSEIDTEKLSFSIRVSIVNKGVGPALNCECYFAIMSHNQCVRKVIPPLTINENWHESNKLGYVISFNSTKESTMQIIKAAINEKDWAIYIQCYDILGKRHVIKHRPDYDSGSILVSEEEDNIDLKSKFMCLL